MKIYICTNRFQKIAAKVSAYSFSRFGFKNIEILETEKINILNQKFNLSYLRNGKKKLYKDDLQSFTLLRFLPFGINKDEDCIVIDPDIFAYKDPTDYFQELNHDQSFLIGCTSHKEFLRSEIIYIKKNQPIIEYKKIVEEIFSHEIDYNELINFNSKKYFKNLKILSSKINQLDNITTDTLVLHTTNRITQPWKEGLKIDFDKKDLSITYKIKTILKMLLNKKYDRAIFSKKYLQHNNKIVLKFIIEIFREAIKEKYLSIKELEDAVNKKYVSQLFLSKLNVE